MEEGSDYCVITPPAKVKPAEIDTYDDHRMAMTFSLAACADVPVTIKDLSLTTSKFLKVSQSTKITFKTIYLFFLIPTLRYVSFSLFATVTILEHRHSTLRWNS